MSDCETKLSEKCSEIKSGIVDDAANLLQCGDIDETVSNFITSAALLKLLCVMNKIAQKTYPIGDVVPPNESLAPNTTYWVGNMPQDFALCDVSSAKYDLNGSVYDPGSGGSGSGGSGGCPLEKWNIKVTPPTGSPYNIFEGYVTQDELFLRVIEDENQSFSTEFENLNKIIAKGSRLEIVSGDCVIGNGLRIDFLGFLPLDCK